MNRLLFLSLCATPVLAAVVACAGDDGGTIVGSGGSPTGASGTPGTSGSTSGGDTNTGGMAGTSPMGGSGGSVTPTAGTAGATFGGGGAGGTPAGGTAGTPAGGGGAGGTMGGGGAGGSGGGAPPLSIESLVGKLDGHLVTMPCGDTPNTDDCSGGGWIHNGVTKGCSGGKLDSVVEYPVNGMMGKTYNVTMHFYGIMEPKNYGTNNVMREGGNTAPDKVTAMPLPWATQPMPGQAYRGSDYNTYEVHVINPGGTTVGSYFINSDTGEGHWTFAINYEKTIPVIGGGKVRVRIFDANCRQIKNCGSGAQPPATQCAQQARTVNISAAMPAPPANALQQPGLGREPQHSGQWFLIDVTNVAPAP